MRKTFKTVLSVIAGCALLVNAPVYTHARSKSDTGQTQYSSLQKVVRGIVKSENGEPLIGVSISIKGTSKGTTSDIDGNFSIECMKNDVLVLSYIGFNTVELRVNNQSNLAVTLKEDTILMDEVIVVGYGTTSRRKAIGAVDQVKQQVIKEQPVANVTQALQGASPSLVIQQRSMDPNNNSLNINIRGLSTMNNNSPLIVIDGLIADGSSLNRLNPNDIDNISVLKDAGTAAIYGSRSANGVILITTKTGQKNQRPKVSLTGQVGFQDPKILFQPVSGYQNATMANLALTNVGQSPTYSPAEIRDLYDHRGDEKWNFDEIIRTSFTTKL